LSEIPLNKFEKIALVRKLLKDGKTYREICHIAHVAPRVIKPIAKEYERKKRLESKKREQENPTKKPSISTQSFILYKEKKQIDDVKILLNIPFKLAFRYWKQYLKSIDMFESYEFYKDYQYDIPTFLSIRNFMKRNNISGNNIANVLREATDIINLNQTYSNLKAEIEGLKQTKNNYSLNQNTNYHLPQLLPLGLPAYYYGY
jgi:hypothetical protein